jgi:hypothetical protein
MSDRNPELGGLEIPDLDLEPVVSKRPAPSAPRGVPAAVPVSGKPSQGRELDLEAGPGIQLSSGSTSAHGSSAFGAGFGESSFGGDDDDFELVATGASVELLGSTPAQEPARQAPGPSWPTGRTRASDQLPVDPMEVTLLADYGAVPRNAVLTPMYAYRVLSRRSVLQRAKREQHAALAQAEAERDGALAQLAHELRPHLEASDVFRRLLEPVREIERLAGERSAALSQADEGFREQMGKFDQELGQLGEALTRISAVVAERSKAAELTQDALARAEAKHKRVQIEIRGVMDVARQLVGPAGGDIPPAQAAQLAQLQARAAALEPELAGAKAAHAASSASLGEAQSELRRIEGQSRQVQRQKAAAGGSLEQQLSARAAGVSEAQGQRIQALAEVARAVLASRCSMPVPDATLEALRQHDARVEAQAVRLEMHVRALDSHDREKVRQGIIVTLSALGIVMLAIVLKAVL